MITFTLKTVVFQISYVNRRFFAEIRTLYSPTEAERRRSVKSSSSKEQDATPARQHRGPAGQTPRRGGTTAHSQEGIAPTDIQDHQGTCRLLSEPRIIRRPRPSDPRQSVQGEEVLCNSLICLQRKSDRWITRFIRFCRIVLPLSHDLVLPAQS